MASLRKIFEIDCDVRQEFRLPLPLPPACPAVPRGFGLGSRPAPLPHPALRPSAETYLTLCCGYGCHGDLAGEAADNGVAMADGDFLETVFVLSEAGHKELFGEMPAGPGRRQRSSPAWRPTWS